MHLASIDVLNTWCGSLVDDGLSHFLQIAIFAGLLAGMDYAVGRRLGAHWRCALWLLFFVKLVLPPHLALPTSPAYWWPGHEAAVTAVGAPLPPATITPAPDDRWSPDTMSATAAIAATTDVASATAPSWPTVVVAGWLIGVFILGTTTIVGHRRLVALLRRSEPAPATLAHELTRAQAQVGVRSRVALRISATAISPIVVGLRHPVIHLPRALAERLAPDELRAVLVHELHHVRRGDLWVVALQTITRVLFFYHPAVWWVNAHLARLREVATDRAVLSHPEIDGRAYSIALVEAAALVVRAAPISRFALGVIETKSQLQKRITMNLYQPRSGRVQLGLPGLLSLALLALVSVPMMPAQPSRSAYPPPAGFKAVDAAATMRRVNDVTAVIIDAFNRRDREAYLATFAATPLLLPEGTGLTTSQAGVAEMYLRAPAGLLYEPMHWADRQFFRVDRWIVETGLVGFRFRLMPEGPILSDPRQALTIWEETTDGSLQVKLLAWNKLIAPDELQRATSALAFDSVRPVSPAAAESDHAAVLQAEQTFHQAIEARRMSEVAGFYSDQARLIAPQSLPITGRTAIQRHLEAMPAGYLTRIERQVAHVEGSLDHVLVVNLFRWHFRPDGSDATVSIAGKGVHLWQRNEDGTWQILFDLPNVSQPSA